MLRKVMMTAYGWRGLVTVALLAGLLEYGAGIGLLQDFIPEGERQQVK